MSNKPFLAWDSRVLRNKVRCALRLVLFTLLSTSGALADSPEWLRALARAPLPSYPEETSAVMLLDEQITRINDNGEIHTTYRRAYKILRPEGRGYGHIAVSFDPETRITFLKAWSIPAQGKEYEVKEKEAVELNLADYGTLYDENRQKVLSIPAADPGNVIGYEYEQKRRPNIMQDVWSFQDTIPVRRARYALQLPKGWEFRAQWMNFSEQQAQQFGENGWAWELAEITAIETEPGMPSWRSVAGWLAITYVPSDAVLRSKSHTNWNELGTWYANLAAGRREISPDMKQKVLELTAGAQDSLSKIRALASFIHREIRYVFIAVGIGGFQPHAAPEIFTNKYGDCKDKATLLSAMLKVIGVDSYYVLMNADRGVTAREFPSMYNFNHAILAIRLPEDVPANVLFAVRDHSTYGRLLFFDPTDSKTPLGRLPSSEQASLGLLVTEKGGELMELPLLAPTTNRLLRTGKLTLNPDGTLTGDIQEVRWGAPAVNLRGVLLAAQGTERLKILENMLGASLGGFRLRSAIAENLEDHEASLVLRYSFEAPNYAKSAGNLLLVRPRVLGLKSDQVMERKERKYPVEFSTTSLESDIYEISLPAAFRVEELPQPLEMSFDFAEYRSKSEVKENVLKYSRDYKVKEILVPAKRQDELKKLYRAISSDERNTAVLARAPQ